MMKTNHGNNKEQETMYIVDHDCYLMYVQLTMFRGKNYIILKFYKAKHNFLRPKKQHNNTYDRIKSEHL